MVIGNKCSSALKETLWHTKPAHKEHCRLIYSSTPSRPDYSSSGAGNQSGAQAVEEKTVSDPLQVSVEICNQALIERLLINPPKKDAGLDPAK